jgi:hypothetical protein
MYRKFNHDSAILYIDKSIRLCKREKTINIIYMSNYAILSGYYFYKEIMQES